MKKTRYKNLFVYYFWSAVMCASLGISEEDYIEHALEILDQTIGERL